MKKCVGLILVLVCIPAWSADWPHLRGPGLDGRVAASGTFGDGTPGLGLAWRMPLGSGYSGVAIESGRAVTLFSDGTADWAVSLDAASGKEVWRRRIADTMKGQDGSDDGPLSSPVIDDGRVYLVAPRGELLALKAADGEVVWSKNLTEEFGSVAPHFGFTTTPLVEGDLLILQTGGPEGHAISGLNKLTGETVWSLGDQTIDYQSPTVMTLAGSRQLVAISAQAIQGLDPGSGKIFWTHRLGEEDQVRTSSPSYGGEDRLLVPMSGGVTMYGVTKGGDGFSIEELYRSEVLGGNYAAPVYHDGYLYGFRGAILSCMKAADGERVWRSREPGGKGLILVDDHLVIFGAKGNVVVAEASPSGYSERARIQALEGSGLTWPSFADGRVLVRNLNEIAAVSVTREGVAASLADPKEEDHEFGRFVRELEQAENKRRLIDELLAGHERFPIVEGDYVHFVYLGDAGEVAIAGSWLDIDAVEPLSRVEGTGLHYRSFSLDPGGRFEYRFQLDFESWQPDERNPQSVPAVEGDDRWSELVGANYEVAGYLAEPEGARGRIDNFTLNSEILGYEKEIKVWLPPGYDEGKTHYPLLVVNDGFAWLEKGEMGSALDNLIGDGVAPLVVAFVPSAPRWWLEAGGSRTAEYAAMQVQELLPALGKRYRLAEGADSRGLLGTRFYALATAYVGLKHPEAFGRIAMQSIYLGLGVGDEVEAMIRAHAAPDVTIYLDWNRFDERAVDSDYDMGEDSRTLAGLLEAGGYTVQGGELLDSHGWGGWRNRTDRMLKALYPAE